MAMDAATSSREPLRVLAFEPYDAGSHRQVRELISRHSRHRWTWLTRPGRAWRWRMRLGAVELVEMLVEDPGPCDVIFATSLLSVADLRALLPSELRQTPVVLYMHENQLAYPSGKRGEDPRDVHFGLTNLTSALAADGVLWNSNWNLESFLRGVKDVVRHAPDLAMDVVGLLERIRRRSVVVWPPAPEPPEHSDERAAIGAGAIPSNQRWGEAGRVLHKPTATVRVVWPHRWEHDKGPDELLRLARQCREQGTAVRWTILGWSHERQRPDAFKCFLEEFRDDIEHAGYVEDRSDYWRLLRRADWVLSTARHEFFGIAVVEALLAGCLPWLPDRLSYPEILPESAQGLSPFNPPDDPAAVRRAIARHLEAARSPNAVRRLDEALEEAAHADRSRPGDVGRRTDDGLDSR